MSKVFEVKTGLKQKNALPPMLFNLALEKTIGEMQEWKGISITIGERKIQVPGFVDDLKMLGSSLNDTKKPAQVLE